MKPEVAVHRAKIGYLAPLRGVVLALRAIQGQASRST
jgi:hypothetical protein